MLHLLNSLDVQRLAALTVIVALLILAIILFAWLLSRVVGNRHLGLRHRIWVLASSRLSDLMGLSAEDLLRPSDSPLDPGSLLQHPAGYSGFDAALKRSLKSNPSFDQQLVDASDVLAKLSRQWNANAQATVPTDDLLALVDAVTTESNRLESIRSEISSKLNSVIGDYENARMFALTDFQRIDAAEREVEAMTKAFHDESVTLERLLDAQRRQADASIAYHQSAVECTLAELRNEQVTGDLVGEYVIEVKAN